MRWSFKFCSAKIIVFAKCQQKLKQNLIINKCCPIAEFFERGGAGWAARTHSLPLSHFHHDLTLLFSVAEISSYETFISNKPFCLLPPAFCCSLTAVGSVVCACCTGLSLPDQALESCFPFHRSSFPFPLPCQPASRVAVFQKNCHFFA